MEIDIDDVPWKDDLVTNKPEIIDGYMTIPSGPGWGADINEEVAKAHPWEGHRGSYGSSAPPPSEWTFGLPSVS